jgi:hypothetical protein
LTTPDTLDDAVEEEIKLPPRVRGVLRGETRPRGEVGGCTLAWRGEAPQFEILVSLTNSVECVVILRMRCEMLRVSCLRFVFVSSLLIGAAARGEVEDENDFPRMERVKGRGSGNDTASSDNSALIAINTFSEWELCSFGTEQSERDRRRGANCNCGMAT